MYVKGKTWPTTQSTLKLMIISVEQKEYLLIEDFLQYGSLRLCNMESVGHPLAAFI